MNITNKRLGYIAFVLAIIDLTLCTILTSPPSSDNEVSCNRQLPPIYIDNATPVPVMEECLLIKPIKSVQDLTTEENYRIQFLAYDLVEISTPTVEPTPEPTMTPAPTATPKPTPVPNEAKVPTLVTATHIESNSEWKYFFSTSYSSDTNGNRGEKLIYNHSVAMWQTDDGSDYTNYYKNSLPDFYKWFYADPTDYGVDVSKCALPYGTKFNMRVWNGSSYVYYYDIKVMDDSPTTQYVLTPKVQYLTTEELRSGTSAKGPYTFGVEWPEYGYKFDKFKPGIRYQYINPACWKPEYSGNICGWLDFYTKED